ncbi:hypothetical protein BKA57DRAFT_96335 [Linnemannia elongata]|nr:hypothetical protein BKA57DRAFT_96335 [Linnemannia elongata]
MRMRESASRQESTNATYPTTFLFSFFSNKKLVFILLSSTVSMIFCFFHFFHAVVICYFPFPCLAMWNAAMQFLFFFHFALFRFLLTHLHTCTLALTLPFIFFLFNVFLLFLASLLRSLFVPFCRPFSLCYL